MRNPDRDENLWLRQPLLRLVCHHRVQGVQEVVQVGGIVVGDVEDVTVGRFSTLQFMKSLEPFKHVECR